jgi:predicted membrane-bound spermidine synthase
MTQEPAPASARPKAASDAPDGASTTYLYVLAFFSGMCIMATELCASRLMAPFFGTSTFVWTNIIGVIMIALAIGYMLGGRLADRHPRLDLLLKILLGGSAFLMVLPFIAPAVARALSSGMQSFRSAFAFIFLGSLVSIALLFSLPVILLAMTSPFLIRLIAQKRRVGDSAGRVFALSTIGSVLGTFLPILVFIPRFGTSRTILCFAAALFAVAAFGFTRKRNALFAVILPLPFLLHLPAMHRTPGLVRATESAYQYIEVFDRGPLRYLTYNDALGYQTVANKNGPLTGIYYDYYSLLPLFASPYPQRALILGLGGGIIANQYRFFHPQIAVEGVEIDPQVIDIARTDFALTPQTRVYNQDEIGRAHV